MAAALIFGLTYVALAFGRIPGLRSDRVAAVVVGAALMICFRVLSFQGAERAVDGGTIALLFGMMDFLKVGAPSAVLGATFGALWLGS